MTQDPQSGKAVSDNQIADPIDLVNQQLEQQPDIDAENLTSNPAITPQMYNTGENLRGDLKDEPGDHAE